MNKNIWKIGGVIAIVAGSGALFMAGTSETLVAAIVGAVFVLAGIIASVFKKTA